MEVMAATTNTEAVVATPREGKFNKNAARRVRVAGKIPAVVYGAGKETVWKIGCLRWVIAVMRATCLGSAPE